MCGIAGLFRPGGELDPAAARPRLQAALAALAHRGPDAEGLVCLPEHGLALGHRRLSILDLSDRANQPMPSADGRLLLSYNGEIYNFRELRAELQRGGERMATESDTEVLLAGYAAWGLEGLLSRAAGMFAFALYDAGRRTLILARDRAGKKPLYWAESDGEIAFASELRGLLALLPRRPAVSRAGLEAFLALKFAPAPLSLLDGVEKLPPGSYLEIGRERRAKAYWHPWRRRVPATEDPEGEVERALGVAVGRRLVSDAPVCVFLSGGVDSGLIAAKLAEQGAGRMAAYTAVYEADPDCDESDYAARTARRFGLEHRRVSVPMDEALAVLADPERVPDDPISDWAWVPLDFLSRAARRDGFKVALLGEGSDELFFGYDVMLKGLRQLERLSTPFWRLLAKAGYGLGRPIYDRTHRGHRRFDLWRRAALGLPLYWGGSIGFPLTQRAQIAGPALGPDGGDPAGEFIGRLYRRYRELARDPGDLVNLVCYIEFYTKMGEILLHRVDRVSMAASLEARAPFLDHELCELAFSLPGALKIPDGRLKGLLKRVAARHLPETVVARPKMGFSFPFKSWLRGPLGGELQSCFERTRLFSDGWVDGAFCRRLLAEHRSGRVDHAPRLWMLFSLARWYDRWAS